MFIVISLLMKDLESFGLLIGSAVAAYVIGYVAYKAVSAIICRTTGSSPEVVKKLNMPIRFLVAIIVLNIASRYATFKQFDDYVIQKIIHLFLIAAVAMLLIRLSVFARDLLYERFSIMEKDNLSNRKVRTQIDFLQKTISTFIVFLAIAIALMSFERVREMGASLIASAGIASVIIGFAAQKSIANLLAGLQIAFTQPMRLDDVVIVEGEWGRVEEITLTYVVISIWDQRRLIVPISYFLEHPFQNWTRNASEILGTVFLYLDYRFPVTFIREQLAIILESDEARSLWDRRVGKVQVTDINDKTIQVRILVSAVNSGNAFDLRCLLRERLLEAISSTYPDALPLVRIDHGAARNDETANAQHADHLAVK